MTLVCKAQGCSSDQSTKIDGRDIAFFPLPENETRRQQWLQNCKLTSTTTDDKQPSHLCELHFEAVQLTASRELKPNAVPTIFGRVEESQRKHKAENVMQTGCSKSPPLKQKKLDENSHNLVTPPHSPSTRSTENAEDGIEKIKAVATKEHELAVNGSSAATSALCKEMEIGKKIYRLTIQIDKIRAKPGPRSKKLMSLMGLDKAANNIPTRMNANDGSFELLQKLTKKLPCEKGGCKLKKSMYESMPAFQCEHCDKYYVMKRSDTQEEKNNLCTICYKSFASPQLLYVHVKKHFVCDMCQTECSSQVTYDKHARLHVSTDPLFPYKCHQCTEIFELKEDAKQHYLIMHPTIKLQNTVLKMTASPIAQPIQQQTDHRCITCNITFRNEQAYRNHVNSHKKKEGLRCNISDTNNIIPVPNPLTGSQIGILRAVKFSCRVCSKEFDNVAEVDQHTRIHLEDVEDEHKCNICKKVFKTSALLNEHLKHHLSRAHPCPVCPKAFINRTTLKIHLKTHGES